MRLTQFYLFISARAGASKHKGIWKFHRCGDGLRVIAASMMKSYEPMIDGMSSNQSQLDFTFTQSITTGTTNLFQGGIKKKKFNKDLQGGIALRW